MARGIQHMHARTPNSRVLAAGCTRGAFDHYARIYTSKPDCSSSASIVQYVCLCRYVTDGA